MSEKTAGGNLRDHITLEMTRREVYWLSRAFDYYLDAKAGGAGVSREEAVLAWSLVPPDLEQKAAERIAKIDRRELAARKAGSSSPWPMEKTSGGT